MVCKYFYEYYSQKNFSFSSSNELAEQFGLSITTVNRYIRFYIKNYLDVSEEEKERLLQIGSKDQFKEHYLMIFNDLGETSKEERKIAVIEYWYKCWKKNDFNIKTLKELAKKFNMRYYNIVCYLREHFSNVDSIDEKAKIILFNSKSDNYSTLYEIIYPGEEEKSRIIRRKKVIEYWFNEWVKSNYSFEFIKKFASECLFSETVVFASLKSYILEKEDLLTREKNKLLWLLDKKNQKFEKYYSILFSDSKDYNTYEKKKIVLEHIYETWRNGDYNYDIIKEFSQLLCISNTNLLDYMEIYMAEYLNLKYNELPDTIKKRDLVKFYYNKIYPDAKILPRNEMEFLINKYFYEYCEMHNWNNKDISMLAVNLNLNIKRIKELAKKYKKELEKKEQKVEELIQFEKEEQKNEDLQLLEEELEKTESIITQDDIYVLTLKSLYYESNFETIISILDNSGLDCKVLKDNIITFILKYIPEDYEKATIQLSDKINKYIEYKNSLVKITEENILTIARETILGFVYSEHKNIASYIQALNYNVDEVKKMILTIRNKDSETYNKYLIKISNLKGMNFVDKVYEVLDICCFIKNGINVNSECREFDLLDYYRTTNWELNNLEIFAKNYLSLEDYKTILMFVKENKRYRIYSNKDIKMFLLKDFEIGAKLNKYGYPILGTGTVITPECKIEVINFLKENNIPINEKTLSLALNRFINKTLYKQNNPIIRKKIKK